MSAFHTRTVPSALPEDNPGASPVRAERHAAYRARVASERLAEGLAGGGVRHPYRVVATARDHRCPSGLNATLYTVYVPVIGRPIGWPVAASHTRMCRRHCPRQFVDPSSGLNATLHTVSVWPSRGCPKGLRCRRPHPHRPVPAAGQDPLPILAERHGDDVLHVAGQRRADRLAGGRVHTRTVLSALPETIRCPSD